jgi:predicted alpha/beta superfamily hydrolase
MVASTDSGLLRSIVIQHLPLEGELRRIRRFRSRFLATKRDVLIYLPAAYHAEPERRFPVLYLQDGQNLFDPDTAFAGVHWRVGESVDQLIHERRISPLIVVGIENTGPLRVDDYTPTRDRAHAAGGGASLFGRLLVEELKPRIDTAFRTVPERESTGIGGSSLGGLLSLYVGLDWPETFGSIMAMSPSVWWDRRSILRRVRSLPEKPSTRIWIDSGTREGTGQLPDVRRLQRTLSSRGWTTGEDLGFHVASDSGHDEGSWAARFPEALSFLFPPS